MTDSSDCNKHHRSPNFANDTGPGGGGRGRGVLAKSTMVIRMPLFRVQ